jgi:ethanolamine kinase
MFPSNEFMTRWLEVYKKETYKLQGIEKTEQQLSEDVALLLRDVKEMVLAANLYWGVWALVQNTFSTVDFDYSDYSRKRLRAYYHFKQLLF